MTLFISFSWDRVMTLIVHPSQSKTESK